MEKKHLDNFFNTTVKMQEYKQFGLTLPITLIYKNLYNEIEHYLKETYDLIHSEIDVLAALYFNGKLLSPTDLYAATVFSSGGMTKILKKLEQRGYISRIASKEDKRSMLVKLEIKGEELVTLCLKEMVENRRNIFEVLSKEEIDSLEKILKKLTYTLF
ncbi:MarR family winged helix-turn-helix transcriptional regulator [Malaciobacter mytili]|uniref:MarR family winged helix-turn-helix transcriptional regulator n=1 Tax=Malaciobacter mytili TaxID=603050 RepID=UPI003A877DB0